MSLFLNGVNVTSSLHAVTGSSGEGALIGVVSGFVVGNNLLQLKPPRRRESCS
jgi:hypothetical protein